MKEFGVGPKVVADQFGDRLDIRQDVYTVVSVEHRKEPWQLERALII
jgi:hypothetical protein